MEERTVDAASMFDVNKAIMRCLVKNLAMFGLGLYVYAGEDLPDDVVQPVDDEFTGIGSCSELDSSCKSFGFFPS